MSADEFPLSDVTPGCRILRNVGVHMRDGVRLATTVILPEAEGSYPVILVRSAYGRVGGWAEGKSWASKGYAYVTQDCRGRFDSEGDWYPFTAEAEDGHDTLEWIGGRPWCDGNIGMVGASYLAATQFYAAPEGSRYLKSLIPMFMTGDPWLRAYYSDGAFSLALNVIWLCFEVPGKSSESPLMNAYDMTRLFRTLPLERLDEASGSEPLSFWRDYVGHWTRDEYWEALSIVDKYDAFAMPVMLIAGWYDYYPREMLRTYLGLVENAPTPELAAQRRIVIGPWGHGITGSSQFGDLDFGPEALVDTGALFGEWFDRTLKGEDTPERTPIRLFVMGANQWRDEYEWPLARTEWRRLHLRSGGGLSIEAPGDEAPDGCTYDPDDPVPTVGGNHSVGLFWEATRDVIRPGPFDQREVEARDDVLVYTTEPLDRDTEVTGPVVLKLHAASSAPDTDFTAKLTDVFPDGPSINITEGVIRARFRERDWRNPQLIQPGDVYEYAIDLHVTSNVFKQGHRIRLDITSSNFPLWDRNPNTGHEPGIDAEVQVARQTIHHSAAYPSHLILPVIPPDNALL